MAKSRRLRGRGNCTSSSCASGPKPMTPAEKEELARQRAERDKESFKVMKRVGEKIITERAENLAHQTRVLGLTNRLNALKRGGRTRRRRQTKRR